MKKQYLHQNWNMREVGAEEFVTATVPGSVYQDYLDHGLMEDPYYRANELDALELMKKDFEYRTRFEVEENVMENQHVFLRFDGIDTVADIWLNGTFLGRTDNMHRIWEFPVKHLLKGSTEENELRVVLNSPVNYIYDLYEKDPLICGSVDAMKGSPYLRKAHCMFGWDWGPRLPDAGIWKDVSLVGYDELRMDSVYLTQIHENGTVKIKAEPEIWKITEEGTARCSAKDACSWKLEAKLTAPSGEILEFDEKLEGLVEQPQLWWPNGFGAQPLYDVSVKLYDPAGTVLLDSWERKIGLRTMKMIREKDEWGECFCHEVNGVRIFAMGADYIPEDNILARVTPERTRTLLEQAKNAHFNCVRVWGGGHYATDAFYDACDELGLLVWQDFMFACSVYDLTEEFEANIRQEFIDNIRRIRHHASLALWCGNNEMEMFLEDNAAGWCLKPSQFSDYFKMYEYILPQILKEYDPNTFYWPASPSSGGGFDCPNDENRGDVHYWDVWHGNKPITEFRKFYFRYLSEFGFQSFPCLETVKTYTEERDRNVFSYVMEKHQRNQSANGKIMNYMEQTYLYPTSFDVLLYASQLLQAEAMRYGVEHFRRNRGRCMGSIIWQLNDCWPTASWSMLDYEGRWKAVQYYAKRFFAPMMLSCEEEGILSQDMNVNAEPFELKKSIRLCVANETCEKQEVTVCWQLRDACGTIRKQAEERVCSEALSSRWLDKVDMADAKTYRDYVSYEMKNENGEVISGGSVLFCAPKHFEFEDPCLKVEVLSETELLVSAEAYAKSVEIQNADATLLLEDNYFDMNPGTRRIRVLSGSTEQLQIRSVYDIR